MLTKVFDLISFVYFNILCKISIGASISMSFAGNKSSSFLLFVLVSFNLVGVRVMFFCNLLVSLRFDAETESLSSLITVFLSIST